MNIKNTKPKTSTKDDGNRIFPYLLKDMDINKPNQVWMTDITYIRLRSGFVYLYDSPIVN